MRISSLKIQLIITVVFLVGMILTSCEKDKNTNIQFTGITETDEMGNFLSYLDTTDWRTDDQWTDIEENLFTIKGLKMQNTLSENVFEDAIVMPPRAIIALGAYPNPCRGNISLYFGIDTSMLCNIRLVNNNFDILVSYDSINYGNFRLLIDSTKSNYKLLRLYYKIFNSRNIYRGHGDIAIAE